MKNRIKPQVTLVGAGPGDPDLLTIKGAKALSVANVFFYYSFSNYLFLSYSSKKALKS